MPDGGQLVCDEIGSGPPLVLVSGLGGLASFWRGFAEACAGTFRVITYDHRGAGRSSALAGPTSVQAMADDLLALLEGLGTGPVHLVGHSTGGAIAQRIAIDQPESVSRLVLSATFARPCPYMRRLFDGRLQILDGLGLDAYRRHAATVLYPPWWIAANDRLLEEELIAAAARARPGEAVAIRARIQAIMVHNCLDALPSISCPTQVVVAADDAITPVHLSRAIAEAVPGTRLTVLPDGGHYAVRTRPDLYRDALLPFLTAASGDGLG
jgi:aminoacrylate hydrolase